MPNTNNRTPNPKSQTQTSKSQTQNPKPKTQTQNPKLQNPNPRTPKTQNPKPKTQNPRPKLPNQKSKSNPQTRDARFDDPIASEIRRGLRLRAARYQVTSLVVSPGYESRANVVHMRHPRPVSGLHFFGRSPYNSFRSFLFPKCSIASEIRRGLRLRAARYQVEILLTGLWVD